MTRGGPEGWCVCGEDRALSPNRKQRRMQNGVLSKSVGVERPCRHSPRRRGLAWAANATKQGRMRRTEGRFMTSCLPYYIPQKNLTHLTPPHTPPLTHLTSAHAPHLTPPHLTPRHLTSRHLFESHLGR